MIQAFLRRFREFGGRRVLGLLLVVAISVLAVAGAVHASHDDCGRDAASHGATDDPCSVCDAVLASAGAAIPAPTPAVAAVERREIPVPDLVPLPPLVSEPGRVAAPRGPPARS